MNLTWSALSDGQKKIAIGVMVLAVLQVAALAWFLFGRSGESAGRVREKLDTLQMELSEARDVILRQPMVEEELENSIAELKKLSSHAPAVFDRYAWAYEYISRRSAMAGVMIDGLQEEGHRSGDDEEPAPYEISISTQCGYNELVRFLWYLEEGNPLIAVRELSIDKSPDDQEQHRVRIVVQWPPAFSIETAE